MIASMVDLTGTRRRDDHAGGTLAVAEIVEGPHQQAWFLRIALRMQATALSSDCPAVKRGATCSPSIAFRSRKSRTVSSRAQRSPVSTLPLRVRWKPRY